MSTAPSYLDKKNLGATRPGISQAGAVPASPHTPQRNPPSTFSSPGAGLRSEEDYAVFEVGARHICAGFAGDSRPKCTLHFDQEESRRVGDFRKWVPGYEKRPPLTKKSSRWSSDYELWQLDLRDADVSLIEDKFERAVREAYDNYLVQDSKARKLVLVVPSALPHPLLNAMFSLLFRNFQIPGITLLPTAMLALVAAGQRSGIIVDIGWHETVVTAIYELREIASERTTRAMKSVTLAMAELTDQARRGQEIHLSKEEKEAEFVKLDFESAEEAVARLAWCWPSAKKASDSKAPPPTNTTNVEVANTADVEARLQSFRIAADQIDSELILQEQDLEVKVTLPSSTESSSPFEVKFADLAMPVERAIFASFDSNETQDDDEQVVHSLIYRLLAGLSSDLRSTCMSNIVVTGGGSNIPGIKSRIMDELSHLISTRGWNLVRGQASEKRRKKLQEIDENRRKKIPPNIPPKKRTEGTEVDDDYDEDPEVPPAFADQLQDPIQDKLDEQNAKDAVEPVSGRLRSVETLGAWSGASMVASLRLKGVVEIERESYLQHGLGGARREAEVSTAKSRQSVGVAMARTGSIETSSWTLGPWT